MTRAPVFPPNVFHRIKFSNAQDLDARSLDEMITSRSTSMVSTEEARAFKRGNGLVVASWDELTPAEVKALGVVIAISATGQCEVEWIRVQFNLPISYLRGADHWKKPSFKFADTVAEDFRLKQFFGTYLRNPFAASKGTT